MEFFKKMKLRFKIILLVILSCFLMTAGGLFSFLRFSKSYESEVQAKSAKAAIGLGDKIGAQFYERYGDIQAFALNPVVRELNSEKLTGYLDEYVRLYGIYDIILVVDKQGHFVASNSKDSDGKSISIEGLKKLNYSETPWFKNVIAEKFTDDKGKGFSGTYFEDFHADPLYKAASNSVRGGVSFSALIKNEKNEVVGVITNRANNRWFENEMKSTFDQFSVEHPDAEVTVVNKDGFIISNLAPKDHDNKIVFDTDFEKMILKKNVFKDHVPVGDSMKAKKSGVLVSKDIDDPSSDLVGFHFLDNSKWPNEIGWTTMVHIDSEEAIKYVTQAEESYFWGVGILAFLGIAMAFWLGGGISKSIDLITGELTENSIQTLKTAESVAQQSEQISSSATQQAAAIQETIAAVDEITAMIGKNSDAASRSKQISEQSLNAAQKGREIVDSMLHSITEIDQSNDELSHQIENSHQQLAEITRMISDIGAKTKVINEIVFQTKLLSFNASVEAARAGEQGKGFSVVAGEVGNLAEMSGKAATEISEMLEASTQKVEQIISSTKTKIQTVAQSSKERVKQGAETAKSCDHALEEIIKNVSTVDQLVGEITTASAEQSAGIQEISKSVGQMEEMTQKNATVAQMSSKTATELNEQSEGLKHIVQELAELVQGKRPA